MKKILLILMAMFAFGIQNVSAQDAPLKIVTNHPDFKIKIKRCAASGKTVVLDLILLNEGVNDVEGVMAFGGQGRWTWSCAEAYDDEGNIYQNENIKIKVANRPKAIRFTCLSLSFPTGVPIKLSLQFNNFSTSAESIARLKLVFLCNPWGLNGDKPVKISNIPITRN